MSAAPLDWALAYATRGWPVFAVRPDKHPLTSHGQNDATIDAGIMREWWRRWPNAIPAIVTGEASGIVALDIDIRPGGNGFDTLDAMGITCHPIAPTAHTPHGGCAILFARPGHPVKTVTGQLGRDCLPELRPDQSTHLDIRADRGSLILPPGQGRFWDPHLGASTPLPLLPGWIELAPPAPSEPPAPVQSWSTLCRHPENCSRARCRSEKLCSYASSALDDAVKAIVTAPAGRQHDTLNRETYTIAGLVAGGTLPTRLALESLQWAARQMRSYDPHRPWRPAELDKAVRAAFTDGLARPRQPGAAA